MLLLSKYSVSPDLLSFKLIVNGWILYTRYLSSNFIMQFSDTPTAWDYSFCFFQSQFYYSWAAFGSGAFLYRILIHGSHILSARLTVTVQGVFLSYFFSYFWCMKLQTAEPFYLFIRSIDHVVFLENTQSYVVVVIWFWVLGMVRSLMKATYLFSCSIFIPISLCHPNWSTLFAKSLNWIDQINHQIDIILRPNSFRFHYDHLL